MSKAKELLKLIESLTEEDAPQLYLSRFTNTKGKLMYVAFFGSTPLHADTEDRASAERALEKAAKDRNIKVSPMMWDGDLGKLVPYEPLKNK